jgi:hypothetical protein
MMSADALDDDKIKEPRYIDIWPVNFFQPGSATLMDHTCLFMLQLGCVLRMAPAWRGAQLRVFLCADVYHSDVTSIRSQLNQLLAGARIVVSGSCFLYVDTSIVLFGRGLMINVHATYYESKILNHKNL